MQYLRKLNDVNGDFDATKYFFEGYLRAFCFHKLFRRNFLLFVHDSTPVNLNALQLPCFT